MEKVKNFLKLIFFVNVIPVAVDFVVYYVLTRTVNSTSLFSGGEIVSFNWILTKAEMVSYATYISMSQQLSNLSVYPLTVIFGSLSTIIITILLVSKFFKARQTRNAILNIIKSLAIIFNFLFLKNLIVVALMTLAPNSEYHSTSMFNGFGDFVFFALVYFGLTPSSLISFMTGLAGPLTILLTTFGYFGFIRVFASVNKASK